MMSKLRVLDRSGDTVTEWDVADPATVETAKRTFATMLAQGYMAYETVAKSGGGRSGTLIREFNEVADEIVMTPRLVGG